MHKQKGQAGLETLIAVATIFIVVLLVQITIIGPNNDRQRNIKHTFEARTILEETCQAINQASYLRGGYHIPLNLSAEIDFLHPYNLTVHNAQVMSIEWKNNILTCQIRVSEILLDGIAGPPFTIDRTNIMISNSNGIIVIE